MTRALAALIFVLAASAVMAQPIGTVRVVVPATVFFHVTNVGAATGATGGPSTVSFDRARLRPGEALRISVKADGDLTGPGGPAIPASNISWTTSNVASGIGINGTMSTSTYTPVYESQVLAVTGRVDLTWTLAAPGASIRAGTHQALLRWKFEVFTP